MEKPTQRCPVGATLNVIGGKWKLLILWQLREEPQRFTFIKHAVEGITQKVLTQQLRELEADGLVERQVYIEMPLRVEYSITPHGKHCYPVLAAMAKWGYENYPNEFSSPLSELQSVL